MKANKKEHETMSKTFLATAVVVATCAVGTTALADDTTSTKTETKSTTTKTSNGKKDGKSTTKKAKEEDSASELNKSIVGEEQQKKNEQEAEHAPRQVEKEKKETHKTAQAIGRATTTAAEAVATGVESATNATDKPGKYNPLAISYSPLGLFIGRFSANVEWAPATHHVIIVSPNFTHTTKDVAVGADSQIEQTFTGIGGEIGYRYYTGHKGMNGVFFGPSLIGGIYNASLPNGDQAFTNYGLAVDVGLQEVFADHIVIGGGVGLEYLGVSHDFGDLSASAGAVASAGFHGRVLLSAGYAF